MVDNGLNCCNTRKDRRLSLVYMLSGIFEPVDKILHAMDFRRCAYFHNYNMPCQNFNSRQLNGPWNILPQPVVCIAQKIVFKALSFVHDYTKNGNNN